MAAWVDIDIAVSGVLPSSAIVIKRGLGFGPRQKFARGRVWSRSLWLIDGTPEVAVFLLSLSAMLLP